MWAVCVYRPAPGVTEGGFVLCCNVQRPTLRSCNLASSGVGANGILRERSACAQDDVKSTNARLSRVHGEKQC